jgi:uncharacterized protein
MCRFRAVLVLGGMAVVSSNAGLQFDFLKKKAEGGDSKARFEVGVAYEKGDGVERDWEQAAEWYLKAAKQNHPAAQLAVGFCYANGTGVELNDEMGFVWTHKSAELYYAPAQYALGKIYEEGGLGQARNAEQAVLWIRRAATRGHCDAQFTLGNYYHQGFGVKAEIQKALEWYLRAADQGSIQSQLLIARNFDAWSGYLPDDKVALDYLRKMAKQGDSESQLNLGVYYRDRDSGKQNLDEAVKWLELSGGQGNIAANKLLAHHYLKGLGTEKDERKAVQLYISMANAEDSECQEMLGCLYAGEDAVEMDLQKSAEWYVRAAKNGRVQSQIKCIFIYGKGLGVELSRVEAYAWALIVSSTDKSIYRENLEPILSIDEKMKANRRFRALLMEIRELRLAREQQL